MIPIAVLDRPFAQVIERRNRAAQRFDMIYAGDHVETLKTTLDQRKESVPLLVINVSRMERDPMDDIMELVLGARPRHVLFTHRSRNRLLLKQLTTIKLRNIGGVEGVSVVREELAESELWRVSETMLEPSALQPEAERRRAA